MVAERYFQIGQVVFTAGIAEMMAEPGFASEVESCLDRHRRCDWGDLSEEDREMNEEALALDMEGKPSDQIMSAYNISDNTIWIITEWNRKITTVLLPNEY